MATKVSITNYKQCAILQLQSVAKQLKRKCVRVVPDSLQAYKNTRGGVKSGLATRDFTDVFCMQLSRDM